MRRKHMSTPPSTRFWRFVDKKADNECWNWTGAKRRRGYGTFRSGARGSKQVVASRYSYELHFGQIADGLVVMHKCDNPSCVNPSHLIAGTARDNAIDCVSKKRMKGLFAVGDGRSRGRPFKLTLSDAREIKHSSRTTKELSKTYSVDAALINRIRSGKVWRHA